MQLTDTVRQCFGNGGLLTKTMRVMQLSAIFLLGICLQVSAAGVSQTITFSGEKIPLENVFSVIEKQTGYYVVYYRKDIENTKPVTVNVKDQLLQEFISEILKGQGLEFLIKEKTISVKKVLTDGLNDQFLSASLNTPPINGIVRGPDGQPIVGANVVLKGTQRGTTTTSDGSFSIEANNGDTVIISSIGFVNHQLKVTKNSLGSIILVFSESKLDEVQIIAYGTTSKRFSTSSVETITAKEIATQPVSNPLLALSGRVPGLFIQQQSGVPGANVSVTIQGKNSLQNGSEPFYVIDGVPYSAQFTDFTLAGQAIQGSPVSSFNFINPSDIENVSILKDADATAIYGSRAANGAILITTKKGKAGKTKVNLDMQNSWGRVTRRLDLLKTNDYLNLRKEAYINAGLSIPTINEANRNNYDLTAWDANKNTDWQNELIGGTAQLSNLQGSISGGNTSTQFLAAYGYSIETSVYPGHVADQKGNVKLSVNHQSLNGRFRYNVSVSYVRDKNNLNGSDLTQNAIDLAPNTPDLFKSDGSLNWAPLSTNPNISTLRSNPGTYTKIKYIGKNNNLIANNIAEYELLPGLVLKTNLGFNELVGNETQVIPITIYRPEASIKTRASSFLDKSISSWIIEPQITFSKKKSFSNFNALIGSTILQTKTNVLQLNASGFTDDAQLLTISSAPNVSIGNEFKTLYKYNALFGRINYILQDKYVININARRDGSSRFGEANRFHNFYSVGGAWLFSEENYIKTKLPWLSSGKLRLNYGSTGNDQIRDYRYMSLLQNYPAPVAYQQMISLYYTNISNPFLQWEETKKLNAGIALGLLNQGLQIDVNYFRNRSSNQLIPYQVPSTTGFMSIDRNIHATVQNNGIEMGVSGFISSRNNLHWETSMNVTISKNKLISFSDLETSPYFNTYIVGEPTNIIRTYSYAGVNPTTGLYEVYNDKGERTSDPDPIKDKLKLMNLNPKFYGGFYNKLNLQRFELSVLFQFVNQIAPTYEYGNLPGVTLLNQPATVADHWTTPGQHSKIQRVSMDNETIIAFNALSQSDAAFADASYIRLKNISFSYSLNPTWLKKILMSQARFFINTQNIITITKFKGTDPETQAIGSLPPLKMINIGFNGTF
jgi:TonB-dependent starch-binding outer membrane protein SusC